MGSFTQVATYDGMSMSYVLDNTVDTSLVTGNIYRFKYRALNAIDYSDFSDITSAAMARLPTQANSPTKIVALSTQTTLAI